MSEETKEQQIKRPFTVFNFKVEIDIPDISKNKPLCESEFAECDGLEMSMQAKTIREGGDNTRQIHLNGPVNYGQVTLKRGMTSDFHLWKWFTSVQQGKGRGKRYDADIIMIPADRKGKHVRFKLSRCVPVKIKAPALNAKDGLIAIEEMQLAYERLDFEL